MASVINRTTLEFRKSVNTPDFNSNDYIINPDMSAVAGIPIKYWKISGDNVLAMTQLERDAVDAVNETSRLQSLTVPVGTIFQYTFGDGGINIQNKWLQIAATTGISSNETPLILGYTAKLQSIQWGNTKGNINTTIEIHSLLNGTSSLKYSRNITNRSEFISLDNILVTFHPEEQIGVYLKRINNDRPSKVSVTLFFMVTSSVENSYTDNNETLLS